MTQHYSDPAREAIPTALPDIETFYVNDTDANLRPGGERIYDAPGWYWWSCLPGCLPDSDPIGPFATEEEALADAREGLED